MEKIRLDIDKLSVESFAAQAAAPDAPGTVNAHAARIPPTSTTCNFTRCW
ncbi:MAG TPA: hypothetical protein VF771_16420 [Longimicrobiaceae bacterium]